jgi:hypothetical protein
LVLSYAACDPICAPAAIFIKDNIDRVPHKHLDLVELHFAGEIGKDFAAVIESYSIFEIGEDFGYLASGSHRLLSNSGFS